MDTKTIEEAAKLTGCLRYWCLDELKTILTIADRPFPEKSAPVSDRHAALSKAYWRLVRWESPGFLEKFFAKRNLDVPETREEIVAKVRADGFDGVWSILDPSFCGQEAIPTTFPDYSQILLELGPTAVGLAIRAFKVGSFETQDAFHLIGITLLRRAKLLTPLIVSFIEDDEISGERIALVSVGHHRTLHPTVRALLKAVAGLSGYEVVTEAGLAKLDEYPEEKSDLGDLRFLPHEYPGDVVCKEYDVPGGLEEDDW